MTDQELIDLATEFDRTHPSYVEALIAYETATAAYQRAIAAMDPPYVIVATDSTKPSPRGWPPREEP